MCAWKIAVCTFRLFDLLLFYPDKQMLENPNLFPSITLTFTDTVSEKRGEPEALIIGVGDVSALLCHTETEKKCKPRKLINPQKNILHFFTGSEKSHYCFKCIHQQCVSVVWVTTYICLCKRLGVCSAVAMVILDPGDFGLILAPIGSVSSCRGSPSCGGLSSCWFR